MKYKVCKLKFSTGVHLGDGRLTDARNILHADTLFSALCIEAFKSGGEERLESFVKFVKEDKIKISNGFPYVGECLFLPKPMILPNRDKQKEENAKEYKKLEYISAENFSVYLAGRLNPKSERMKLAQLGISQSQAKVAITGCKEPEPYHIGVYYFRENCGLYILIAYERQEYFDEFLELLDMVGVEGIGGKRSSGLGKFEVKLKNIPDEIKERLINAEKMPNKVTLSVALPKENELEKAMEEASYLVEKRSGFVASETYANTWRRKKDIYCFQAGSSFKNTFSGDVYNVALNGRHPVYRYAKPFFMGVNI